MTTYQIATLKHCYQPDLQGDEMPRIYSDHHGQPIEYDSVAESQAVINEWDADIYVTDHNESGRPTYVIVESGHGDYIHGGRNGDMSNYDWDDNSCKRNNGDCCGECNECFFMMIEQDRQYLLSSAVTL